MLSCPLAMMLPSVYSLFCMLLYAPSHSNLRTGLSDAYLAPPEEQNGNYMLDVETITTQNCSISN